MCTRSAAAVVGHAIALLAVWLLACVTAPVAQEKTAVTVGLGFATGAPGKTVTLPLSLQGAKGRNISRVVSRVTFPARQLAFVRIEKVAVLEGDAPTETTWEVRDERAEPPRGQAGAPPPDPTAGSAARKVLELRVSSADESAALVDGILAYVVFRIQKGAEDQHDPDIPLGLEAVIVPRGAETTAPPLAAVAEPGKVLVETGDVPILACFLYMH